MIKKNFFDLFPAFKSKNYQLYFIGQLVSLIGTWLQQIAQGWLVLQLTNSAFILGLIMALSTLPIFLFSLFGGVIVDRFHKKTILYITQISSGVLAGILGVLTVLGVIQIWHIGILAFLLGVVNAVDLPARQSFAIEMVKKEWLASAIALNAGIFNSARVIGPSIAGFLIGTIGIGGAFLLNAASYIAVIIALLFIAVQEHPSREHPHPLRAIKEGLRYAFTHSVIRIMLMYASVCSIFAWAHATILPLIAKQIFHVGATGLGFMFAASGIGAIVALILVSGFSKKIPLMWFLSGGGILFSISMILLTLTHNFYLALFFLFFTGTGLLSQFSMLNTTIQHLVDDRIRGRVMSVYVMALVGLMPIGSLQIGYFAEHFGAWFAVRLSALVVLIAALLLLFYRKKITTNLV